MIQFNLPYPVSTNRYWRTSRNITHISADGKKFKESVHREYQWTNKPVTHDVSLIIWVHPKLTKGGEAYKTIIDLDNCTKCVLDSLIGIAYFDDKQVKKISLEYGPAISGGATTVFVQQFLNRRL